MENFGDNQKEPKHFDEDPKFAKHTKKVIHELRKLQEKTVKPAEVFGKRFKKK
tara:strand:+ start:1047 stop:1205 length:159 start_codon:yes stop_codon:yes gene_type:complete